MDILQSNQSEVDTGIILNNIVQLPITVRKTAMPDKRRLIDVAQTKDDREGQKCQTNFDISGSEVRTMDIIDETDRPLYTSGNDIDVTASDDYTCETQQTSGREDSLMKRRDVLQTTCGEVYNSDNAEGMAGDDIKIVDADGGACEEDVSCLVGPTTCEYNEKGATIDRREEFGGRDYSVKVGKNCGENSMYMHIVDVSEMEINKRTVYRSWIYI